MGMFQYLMGIFLITIDDINYTVTMENENDNIDISRLFIGHNSIILFFNGFYFKNASEIAYLM